MEGGKGKMDEGKEKEERRSNFQSPISNLQSPFSILRFDRRAKALAIYGAMLLAIVLGFILMPWPNDLWILILLALWIFGIVSGLANGGRVRLTLSQQNSHFLG